MLDAKFVRDNIELVKEKVRRRGLEVNLEAFTELDAKRRHILHEVETLKFERNKASEKIAKLKKEGQDAASEIESMKGVSQKIKGLDAQVQEVEQVLNEFLLTLPNVPHDSVPVGEASEDNPEVRRWGDITEFPFPPKPHWEIGERLDILDFNRGAKITGARFTLYKDLGAKLERALINFMLDLHTEEHHYNEVLPPFMVNRESMTGTGQLPKFEQDLFKIEGMDYFLVPTAEVPVTNIHQNEILRESDLPIYYTAYTPCFRKEAGSYGQDVRGLIRQHQFNKVELVKIATPESSYDELEKLLSDAEEVLKRLGLPYRVVNLCMGDLGFAAAKTYDIEAWLPGQKVFREISSCSNFEDFQSRRANIRYRAANKKVRYAHTLNGSGLAVGRTVVAILENFQQEDGSVTIPPALTPYLHGETVIRKKGSSSAPPS
jgi:seryl-tRNA synthetase